MLKPKELSRLKKIISPGNERLVEIFDTLSDANRCKLFRLAAKNPKANVTDASKTLGISLPLASQHLKLMEQNRLLVKHKSGRQVFYGLNKSDPVVTSIIKVIED